MKPKKKDGKEKFRSFMSYAVFFLGAFLILHNSIWVPPIGSEFVFGVQFLAGSYYIAHGKFKGFD
ncbi:MAG: hypothetical protein Q7S55_03610 [Nanoarchaeota archaeon]|nr:hypothetical protein [Nanoarchaeota archaeon]